MKSFLLSLIIYSSSALASFENISGRTTKRPVIKKRIFFSVIEMMEREFQHHAAARNEELVIYGGWVEPTADIALARRWEEGQVLVYRGMAHRLELNPDALILVICHELGHLYGGAPFKDSDKEISPEGQADYFATNICLEKALSAWDSRNVEKRVISSILNVGLFLANNRDISAPSRDTPDISEVDQTNMRHPSPQCRLDTYFAGLANLERPSCWYKEALRLY